MFLNVVGPSFVRVISASLIGWASNSSNGMSISGSKMGSTSTVMGGASTSPLVPLPVPPLLSPPPPDEPVPVLPPPPPPSATLSIVKNWSLVSLSEFAIDAFAKSQ